MINILEVVDITKKYGQKNTLNGVSLTVEAGEILGILGMNGSGKSTLLSIMAYILKPTSGFVRYDGSTNQNEIKKLLGYVPQSSLLFEEITVLDNLRFWASAYQVEKDLENNPFAVSLLEIGKKKVKHLSGGMKQRLTIAVSILHSPKYILLDEPTSGLDYYYKDMLLSYLRSLRDQGKGIVFVSHDYHDINTICDRILLLPNPP